MTVWQPATQEIDPVLEALQHAARATIAPSASIGTPAPSASGVREVQIFDGRVLRMQLSAQPTQQVQRGVNTAVVYAVSGNAVVDRAGFRVVGQAVLDIATQAFLDVDCRLEPVGTVTL